MQKYLVRSHNSFQPIYVDAFDEAEARRKAMVEFYGSKPDAVCENAPFYNGFGLVVEHVGESQF